MVMHNLVSVDGYIADDNDDVGPLFEWYFNGDVELVDGGPFKVSQASADYVRPMWDSIGSLVIGRHLFDLTNGWEGAPPAGEHVLVVSHRTKPDAWHPEASYHFIDDVAGWCVCHCCWLGVRPGPAAAHLRRAIPRGPHRSPVAPKGPIPGVTPDYSISTAGRPIVDITQKLTRVSDVLADLEAAGEAVVGDGSSDDDAESAGGGPPGVGCGVPVRQGTFGAGRVDDEPYRRGLPGLEGDSVEADQPLRGFTCRGGQGQV